MKYLRWIGFLQLKLPTTQLLGNCKLYPDPDTGAAQSDGKAPTSGQIVEQFSWIGNEESPEFPPGLLYAGFQKHTETVFTIKW